MAKQAGY